MKENKIKPWIILGMVCLMSASNLGLLMNSLGVFYTPVAESLGVMKGSLTLYVTIGSLVSAFVALVTVKLVQRYNLKPFILFGSVCSCGATFLMGYCDSLWEFYILGAIRGLGIQFFSMIIMTMIINYWFVEKHGFATSLVMSFGGIAGAIGSPMLTGFITNYGWQVAYRLYGIIAFALCLPILLYPFKLNPREEGLLPYGYKEKTTTNTTTIEKKASNLNLLSVPFIVFCFVAIFIVGLANMPQHFPGYALTFGFSASIGATLLSASMIGNISSKVVFGILSDKIGAVKTSVLMLVVNFAAIFVLLIIHTKTALLVGSFLYGTIYSMSSVGNALLCKDYFGIENYNKAYPKVTFATGLSGALFATLISYMYDFTGGYASVLIMMALFHVAVYVSLLYLTSQKKKGNI